MSQFIAKFETCYYDQKLILYRLELKSLDFLLKLMLELFCIFDQNKVHNLKYQHEALFLPLIY
jgi:hypothetical protein